MADVKDVKVEGEKFAPDLMGGSGKGLAVIEAFDAEHERLGISA